MRQFSLAIPFDSRAKKGIREGGTPNCRLLAKQFRFVESTDIDNGCVRIGLLSLELVYKLLVTLSRASAFLDSLKFLVELL